MMIIVLSLVISHFSIDAMAQADRQHIRQGNKLYRQEKYDKAEVEYQKALAANQRNPQAHYNLGCAMMMQQKDSAAIVQFENAGKLETEPLRKAMVYHNMGWICQKHQMYGEAIEAYKEAVNKRDKKLLSWVNDGYNIMHLSMDYDGTQAKGVCDEGFRIANAIISRCATLLG